MPRWDNVPQAHSRVSNINIDIWIWEVGPYAYPMKNHRRTAKFFATWDLKRTPSTICFQISK
jgi:hypothetical protein